MPNANDRQIIKRLANDSTLELMPHELKQMLDSELEKPAEEIDVQLVSELVDLLQPDEVPEEQIRAGWQRLSSELNTPKVKTRRLLHRIAAAAAVVVLLFGTTLGAASAFRWTFLLKLLQPVAETFGLYMNFPDDATDPEASTHVYSVSDEGPEQATYHDLSAIPDSFDGHALKPGWIPEGYAFQQATHFPGEDLQVFNMDYRREDDWITLIVSVHMNPDAITHYVYERTLDELIERKVGSRNVTFYRNTDEQLQAVSWIEGNAHYYLSGHMDGAEIEKIVEGIDLQKTE